MCTPVQSIQRVVYLVKFFQLVGYDISANVGRADESRVGSHYQGPETSNVFPKLFPAVDCVEIAKCMFISVPCLVMYDP